MTERKTRTWLAPSTRAASTSSRGHLAMKLCRMKMHSGSAKIECDSQIVQNVPASPAFT